MPTVLSAVSSERTAACVVFLNKAKVGTFC